MNDPATRQAFIDWVTPRPQQLPDVGAGTREQDSDCYCLPAPTVEDLQTIGDALGDGFDWLGDRERQGIRIALDGAAAAAESLWDWASGDDYHPPPKVLPAFPDAQRVRPKTRFPGGLRQRWVDSKGRVYEWDYQHGKVERYGRSGTHEGEYDPETGEQTKPPDPKKSIER
jgi:hypothetical protein